MITSRFTEYHSLGKASWNIGGTGDGLAIDEEEPGQLIRSE